jgi:hypothetical protein
MLCHYAEWHYAVYRVLFMIMLCVVMLSVVVPIVGARTLTLFTAAIRAFVTLVEYFLTRLKPIRVEPLEGTPLLALPVIFRL